MGLMTPEVQAYIGMETELARCCDPVERGAVRRFAQASMDNDPIYMDEPLVRNTRYRAPVAPPLFATAMHRRPFGTRDIVQDHAEDPGFDGSAESSTMGLPALPLAHHVTLNGGNEVELYRLPRHGEWVSIRSRYKAIYERETSRGAMLFVVYESDFTDENGALLIRATKTQIKKAAQP